MNIQNTSERHELFSKWVGDIANEKTKLYIQERIIKQMDWYSTKCKAYKARYQRWTTASIIISAAIPVTSVLADGELITKLLIALLGAAVTGISAYLSLHNYKDIWSVYSSNREWLLSTLYLYFNQVGMFGKEMDQEDRDAMLVDMCERCFQQEVKDWKSINE